MRVSKIFLFCVFIISNLSAQNLKPSIGLFTAPEAAETVCPIQSHLGNFDRTGYQLGDTVHDFTLYDKDFHPFTLSESLNNGKPVLLISSSYTCPIFRGKIPKINQLYSQYKDQLDIYIVYTVEAHPDKDISPYFGRVNTGAANINEGILYRQPLNYGDRLQIVQDMLIDESISVPVLIDGPCNAWWNHYGPAPNNATLIDPDGTVRVKHAWFDRSPNDILCDVKKYLDPSSSCDSIPSGVGQFSFELISDTIIRGEVNATLYAVGTIQNTTKYPMTIEVRRIQNNLPANWSSSMCLDVCYPADVDSTRISLKANEKMDMIIDFFTGPVPATGRVRIAMRNVDNTQNRAIMDIRAMTHEVTSTYKPNTTKPDVLIYPQPSNGFLHIRSNVYNQFILFDEKGVVHQKGYIDEMHTLDRKNLPSGLYFIKLSQDNGQSIYQKVMFH